MADQSLQVETICQKCKTAVATLQVRSEQVCEQCFVQYVTTKAIKRLQLLKFRVSTAKESRKLLLPLSFGISSTSLLFILDNFLQGQVERRSRNTYEVVVLHVESYHENQWESEQTASLLEKYQSRFPRRQFLTVKIEDALKLQNVKWDALGLSQPDHTFSGKERLETFLNSISEATSKNDVLSILMNLLIVDVAKQNQCDGILFGDSTTRLAEKTLAETAKGRGFSLPWQVSDGLSPYGVNFYYPLRDILKKELLIYSSRVKPPLTDLVPTQISSHAPVSLKSTTIDDLMTQYFESVEENYPSIVANVVRTSSKLQPSIPGESRGCDLCGLPVIAGADGIHGWGGDQASASRVINSEISDQSHLCYGCSRSTNG